jgi:hypothetical protein
MVADWEGLTVEGGGGTVMAAFESGRIGEGIGDFGVRGWWTESREDRRGSGMLELGREGAERQRGAGQRPALLNALGARQREKGGEGVWLGAAWGQEKEQRGRGRGTTPREPARHRHGSSGPLGQQRVVHVARARWTRANRGGGGHARRGGSG